MFLQSLLSKWPGMAIKRTNIQTGLCNVNAAQVTQGHQILEGNEDSYSCILPRATAESMTYEAKAVPKTNVFLRYLVPAPEEKNQLWRPDLSPTTYRRQERNLCKLCKEAGLRQG